MSASLRNNENFPQSQTSSFPLVLKEVIGDNLADKWILSRLSSTIKDVRDALDEYRFNEAAASIYQFVWHEFCDWYIEIIKPRLYGKERNKENALKTLLLTLETSLRLLHPFMPFITEEIWSNLREINFSFSHSTEGSRNGSILCAPYPEFKRDLLDTEAEKKMETLIKLVSAIRSIRGNMNVPPGKKIRLILKTNNPDKKKIILKQIKWVITLAGLERLEFWEKEDKPQNAAVTVVEDVEIFVLMGNLMVLEEEKTRLQKEIKKNQKELDLIEKKLSNNDFINKAPANIIEKNRDRQKNLIKNISKLKLSIMENLKKI